jgi:hypothetical protein
MPNNRALSIGHWALYSGQRTDPKNRPIIPARIAEILPDLAIQSGIALALSSGYEVKNHGD